MTPRELEEYIALRATIRDRGTARVWLFLVGLIGWAGLTIATAALAALPVATLLPLLVLAAAFEVVFVLHTGVERIGRYIQVFFEEQAADPGWEHRVMAFGQLFPGGGSDPLFTVYFLTATLFNFVPLVLAGAVPTEYVAVGAIHGLFIVRIAAARRHAARQRGVDLERFERLKREPATGQEPATGR
jgi:hypothetical protein